MRTFWIIILAGAALAVFAYWNRKAATTTTDNKTDVETAAEIFNRLGVEAGKLALKPTGVPVPPQVTLSVI